MSDDVRQMKLSRRIPARTKTVEFTWIKRDFMLWSFFSLRRTSPSSCWWCNHPFDGDDMMALAGVKGKTNKLICQRCAAEALGEATDE